MAADLDRRGARLGLGPVIWLITVFGVYVTVPDTELIRPLVVLRSRSPCAAGRSGWRGSAPAVPRPGSRSSSG